MIIAIDPQTRIKGTEQCWQLEYEQVIKGKATWKTKSYHTSFASALYEASQRSLRTHPAQGLDEAFEAVRVLTDKYSQIFDQVSK